jgi:multiple sugar transport system ATP-binding protein
MTEIRFEKVSKRFGDVTVLQDLDLTIRSGEFFTFVGPSGCGKSTVLNMIAGLEDASGGAILFDGAPVAERSPKDRDVAMVFQSYALYPHMTVRENIAFPLRMRKEQNRVIESEVRRVADLLGLGDLLARRPRELSGGQRQRVALGRAIVRRPKVFLMDEPLSNLDARLRVEMRAELKRLHRELGATTVYVTHDQAEAMGLSGRMAVLDRGQVRQVGEPREVYRRPADLFVAGFIGSPPMNFLPCRVTGQDQAEIDCLGRRLAPAMDTVPGGPEVIAGLRPEDVRIAAQEGEGGVEAEVLVTEQAGSVLWVEAQWKGRTVRGMARPDERIKAGDRVFLHFAAGDIVVFDASTGARI